MFHKLDHFIRSWEYESGVTQKLLNHLTDTALEKKITPEHWSLGRIAWHIVTAIKVITSNANLTFDAPAKDWPVPDSAQFIATSYQEASEAFIQAIKAQWHDQTLEEHIDFFGQQMPIGSLLLFLLQHQTHHRGQMTVLMRQAGLTVTGVYGPAKEEWSAFGMEPPKM